MKKTKEEIRQTILDFFDLVIDGNVVLKSYVNLKPKSFFKDEADVWSTRPKEGQFSYCQWGKADDPDADGTTEKPFEFFVHCFKPRTKS